MKLYIETESNNRHYLPDTALTRQELAQTLGSTEITVSGTRYHVNDVRAEANQLVLRAALVMAGIMTAFSLVAVMVLTHWPMICFLSALAGVLTGIHFASKVQQKETHQAQIFNRSRIHFESGPRTAQAA